MGWLALLLAAAVGLLLGLLGGGGSILMVPLLTYVAWLDPQEAIAGSLFAVGVTSLVAVALHARAGNVRWRTGGLFAAGGVVGAVLGGLLGSALPGPVLMGGFAVMMLLTARAMIRGRTGGDDGGPTGDDAPRVRVGRLLVVGLGVGLVTGLVGAGGGFLIVPALVLLAGLPMAAAMGTSLLVITVQTLAGFVGKLPAVEPDWPFLLALTGVSVVGALAGVALVRRVPAATLRQAFGWFVLVMGVAVLTVEGASLLV
ncbi:sulfite exporter TauE/SafE family protein [Micrococcus luteus]|uniref:sulfite exporter TauE/SafE family protein n=1 Tax=Micrococcus luteus TaxID=1270 RepID=UPI000BF7B0A6|nr:sulfite exporter TauE/SafE family protein [Micrococcus luteus]PFH06152.1 hypothetical protein BX598_0776 [Micrococcaceae bacterium JKS001869]QZY83972.1 sulfite exporter TauE/SafE family protein [Micrococcus luteus]